MSYFNMVCDSCGREVQGITWVNGMKFCAKCYQEIFGNKNMTENLKNMYEAYLKILNEKDERIAELEEQLKNSIRPRFKVGQSVWYYHIARNKTYEGIIDDIQWYATRQGLYYRIPQLQRDYFWIREDELFSTKAEAEAKLQELKGAVGND